VTIEATQILRLALRALFCRYPHRLSLGVLTGVVGNALAPIVSKLTPLDVSGLGMIEWIMFGIFVFVFPTVFTRYRLSDDIEAKLVGIRRIAEEGGLSYPQRRLLYWQLARQVLDEKRNSSSLHDSEENVG
jgi:hypothetical protein